MLLVYLTGGEPFLAVLYMVVGIFFFECGECFADILVVLFSYIEFLQIHLIFFSSRNQIYGF